MVNNPIPLRHLKGHSAQPNARLPLWQRVGLLSAVGGVWVTGVLWFWARYFGRREGPFGLESHWGEFSARAAHGFTALLFLVAVGSLVPFHFRTGWETGTKRLSSLSLALVTVILVLTGWGLYYAGGEVLRRTLSTTHNALGFLVLPLFFIHSRRR
ncbi:MAG: hypothetical protein JNK54_06000 [Elusimicrobia bacterium]|jgi:hypothetical protein|nr:hypothetical protein [Elusimicrobiota bacterium]